jgi:NAD(P)-dependent dehydrogenase (short-subunit alcohol dehydrogenase family)
MIENPVALVTGANKGLGLDTARQLAELGATVVLGCRDVDEGETSAGTLRSNGLPATSVQLDVTDEDSVRRVASRFTRDHGRLDILVNNDGVFVDAPALQTSVDQLRRTFETNVFGTVAVINGMLSLLRESSAARVVNIAGSSASMTLISGPDALSGDSDRVLAYAPSKAALNMLTVQYAQAFQCDARYAHVKINSAASGARVVVRLARLPDDGPTGGFFNDSGVVPW